MLWSLIISGLTLGAVGSLHCAGMCGPLSLALPVHHLSKTEKFLSLLLYQFGRVITYSVLGLIFGLAGRRIYISGYQQGFSIILGVIVLVLAAMYFIQKHSIHLSFLNRFYLFTQKMITNLLGSKASSSNFLMIGMANGLLPCGMVYIAIAATLSLTQVIHSVLFMAMFGLGTLPAMMLIAYASQMMNIEVRQLFRKAVPVFITIIGIVLILRGLNLGIPFISPALPHASGQAVVCHV